jgi:hypothetical protein
MTSSSKTARLLLNDKDVGRVVVQSFADSWGFGQFEPSAAFTEFATIFGNWSLLMHADDDESKLTSAASEELRRAEYQIDSLRAELLIDSTGEDVEINQLNIDGPLIEWKVVRRRARRVG